MLFIFKIFLIRTLTKESQTYQLYDRHLNHSFSYFGYGFFNS